VAYQSLVQMAFEDKEVVDNLFGYLQAIWGISTVIAPALVYCVCSHFDSETFFFFIAAWFFILASMRIVFALCTTAPRQREEI